MNDIFVFDIETIPDINAGRRLHKLYDLSDVEVAEAMLHLRRQDTGGNSFLPLHLHRIVAISVVLRSHGKLKIWSLGDLHASEKELLERFFDGIQKYSPTLVSWNGSGFDLPVIHYRALLHGVSAPRYWETGDNDPHFRFNNYLSRYHYRHTDIMDVLAAYQGRANAPLDDIAVMLGLPGKMGMHGAHVWEQFCAGQLQQIRDYCETDVLNTYLIFLRFELFRGRLDEESYFAECERVRDMLQHEPKPHLQAFLQAWSEIIARL